MAFDYTWGGNLHQRRRLQEMNLNEVISKHRDWCWRPLWHNFSWSYGKILLRRILRRSPLWFYQYHDVARGENDIHLLWNGQDVLSLSWPQSNYLTNNIGQLYGMCPCDIRNIENWEVDLASSALGVKSQVLLLALPEKLTYLYWVLWTHFLVDCGEEFYGQSVTLIDQIYLVIEENIALLGAHICVTMNIWEIVGYNPTYRSVEMSVSGFEYSQPPIVRSFGVRRSARLCGDCEDSSWWVPLVEWRGECRQFQHLNNS